jgi:hypothetical protein
MFGPRIPPLPADQLEAEHADLLERIYRDATGASNVATMLLRHPLLFRLWAPLSGGLLYGSLSPHRDRELLILSITPDCHAHYEWAPPRRDRQTGGLTDVDSDLHRCLTES